MSHVTYRIQHSKSALFKDDVFFKDEIAINARKKALEYLYSLPKIQSEFSTLRVEGNDYFMGYHIATNGDIKDFDLGHEFLIRGLNYEYILYKRYGYDIGGSPLKLWEANTGSEYEAKYLLPNIPQPLKNYLYTHRRRYSLSLEHQILINQVELQFIKNGLQLYLNELINILKRKPYGPGDSMGMHDDVEDEDNKLKCYKLIEYLSNIK